MTSDYKNATIKKYGKDFNLHVLVETGTCFGDAIAGVRKSFTRIYSIELSQELYEGAKKRFADDSGVWLFHGDSATVLPKILRLLPHRCLFWLDAHYSGGVTARGPIDTPISKEVDAIFLERPAGVVLIDDADCFTGANAYPTLPVLEARIRAKAPDVRFVVKENIIRITPKAP